MTRRAKELHSAQNDPPPVRNCFDPRGAEKEVSVVLGRLNS